MTLPHIPHAALLLAVVGHRCVHKIEKEAAHTRMNAKRSENGRRIPGNARLRAIDTGALTAAA